MTRLQSAYFTLIVFVWVPALLHQMHVVCAQHALRLPKNDDLPVGCASITSFSSETTITTILPGTCSLPATS